MGGLLSIWKSFEEPDTKEATATATATASDHKEVMETAQEVVTDAYVALNQSVCATAVETPTTVTAEPAPVETPVAPVAAVDPEPVPVNPVAPEPVPVNPVAPEPVPIETPVVASVEESVPEKIISLLLDPSQDSNVTIRKNKKNKH